MSEFIVNIRSFLLSPISTYTNTDHCTLGRITRAARHRVSFRIEKALLGSKFRRSADAKPLKVNSLLPTARHPHRKGHRATGRRR